MRLEYQIAVDDSQMKRSLRGIEGEVKASSRRTARDTSGIASGRNNDAHVRARTREIIRVEQAERRAAERSTKYWQDAHRKTADHRIREEARAERAREREVRRTNRVALRERAELGQRVRGGVSSVTRGVGGALGTVARVGGMAVGLAGGFAAAGALDEQMEIRRRASQLSISAGKPGERGALIEESQMVRGFTGSETLSSMQGFVEKTGNLGAARAMIQDMGRLALATSTDFGEMGMAAGQAFNVIRDTITDPKEQMKALNEVMRNLAAGGNMGAVEIKDMVTELGGLGAATRKFEGGPVELIKSAAAMAQAAIARGGAGTAPETTTAVTRFAQDIVQNQKQFKAAGVDVFQPGSGNTKLKGMEEIAVNVLEKTGGDLTKIGAMFGVFGERALAGVSPLFVDAEKRQKGSGRAAVLAEFKKFTGATLTDAQIEANVGTRLSDPDLQVKEAVKEFNLQVGTQLVPVLTQMIPKFAQLIPTIAKVTESLGSFAGFVMDNPFTGIGAIVGAKIAADIGGGMIRDSIEKSLTTAIATSGGLKVAGGVSIVAASALLVAQQYSELSTQTEGFGGIMAGIGSLLNGGSFAEGVSQYQDERAIDRYTDPFGKEAKARREAQLQASAALPSSLSTAGVTSGKVTSYIPGAGPLMPGAPAPASQSTESLVGPLNKSAAELSNVALLLGNAAAALTAAGPTASTAPARNGPINTRG